MKDFSHLPGHSKVWIYQSSRPFEGDECTHLRAQIDGFVKQWASHNRQLNAYGELFHDCFIVLMVDESMAGASGCSIDSSVHFMKKLEPLYGVALFDRLTFAYQEGGAIKLSPQDEFSKLYLEGKITDETLVFDNLVKTKAQFESEWLKPLAKSWHKRLVPELPVG